MRRTNQAGIDLIMEYEGTELRVYRDVAGLPTVGTGHLVVPEDNLKVGQMITEEEARNFLRADLSKAERGVESALTADITDNQFAACVSLTFNIGVTGFKKSSIAKRINADDLDGAANAFLLYNKARVQGVMKPVSGLTRRRKAERALFLTPDEPTDEPSAELNGNLEPPTTVVKETTIEKTVEPTGDSPGLVEKTFEQVKTIATSEEAKTVASTGFGKLSLKVAGGSAIMGLLSAIGTWWKQNWQGVVFTLVFLGIAYLVYREMGRRKHEQKMEEARIKADKNLNDVEFKKE